jgi:hypothetical protein
MKVERAGGRSRQFRTSLDLLEVYQNTQMSFKEGSS